MGHPGAFPPGQNALECSFTSHLVTNPQSFLIASFKSLGARAPEPENLVSDRLSFTSCDNTSAGLYMANDGNEPF
jgi:hypothetical protein